MYVVVAVRVRPRTPRTAGNTHVTGTGAGILRAQEPLADRRGATARQKLWFGRANNLTLRAHMRTLSQEVAPRDRWCWCQLLIVTRARAEAPDSISRLHHKANTVPACSVRPTVLVRLLLQPSPSLPSPAVWIGGFCAAGGKMSRLRPCGVPNFSQKIPGRVCVESAQH